METLCDIKVNHGSFPFPLPAFGWVDWGAFPECPCALTKSGLGQGPPFWPRWASSFLVLALPAIPRRRRSALVRMRDQARRRLPLPSGRAGLGRPLRRRGPLFQGRREPAKPLPTNHPSFLLSCSSLNVQLEEECIIYR